LWFSSDPVKTEYDELAKDENSRIDEVLSDFQFYASKVKPFLGRQKIRSAITSANIIEIVWSKKNFRFDLKDEFKSYFTIK
jgi:hypothetical protein